MNNESVLTTLPGAADTERVLVVLVQLADGSSKVSLRQQSFGEGVGWFDQKSLDLDPEQFKQLRRGYGATGRTAKSTAATEGILLFPGVVHVESA